MHVSDGYSAKELERLLLRMDAELFSFKKGETVVREGENANRIGVILEGSAHILLAATGGRKAILRMLSAGSIIGLTALIAAEVHDPLSLVAFTDCTVLALSVEKLNAWRREPDSDRFFAAMERQLYEMMLDMAQKCAILSQPKTKDRVLAYLRQRCASKRSRTVVIPGTEADFANYLGVHAVALSRVLKKMREDGLIDYHRNVLTLKETPNNLCR